MPFTLKVLGAGLGIGKYVHPKYYAKRAVNWERHEREAERAGVGCLGIVVGVGMAVAAVVFTLSLPGHVLGLTPTFGEVYGKSSEWLNTHYRHIVWGYLITFGLLMAVILLLVVVRDVHKSAEFNHARAYLIVGVTAASLGLAVTALPVGRRDKVRSLSKASPTSASAIRIAQRQAAADIAEFPSSGHWTVQGIPDCVIAKSTNDAVTGQSSMYRCTASMKDRRRVARFADTVECFGPSPTADDCSETLSGVGRVP